jgi:glycosyltransferase involved in cell wall biosynthesis
MAAPLVTIVIPTCNRPELLDAAVDSALSQTISELEVIVVDDGSTPPAQPRNDDERVHLIRSDVRRGVSWARNAGLAEARGRWIVFLDDDDQLVPEMVALSLEAARRSVLPPPLLALSKGEGSLPGRARGRRDEPPETAPGAFAAARSLFADPRRPHALREFVDCALPSRGPAVWKAVW